MSGQQTRQWVLSNPPQDDAVLSGDDATFSLKTTTLSPPSADQVLVKALYLSNDPAQRTWIQKGADPERMYLPPVQQGEVMQAFGIGEVVESGTDSIKKGQLVLGSLGWAEYTVMNAKDARPVEADESAGINITHHLGVLGFTGLTAYYGLVDVVRTTKEDVVVVSGAAGATGSMVIQIAKHLVGCKKVIGIAGGEKKCEWVESLGADICVDYKSSTFEEDLKKATDGFVDVYFDNVGGEILELMLSRIRRFGRVAACGSISTYNNPGDKGIRNWFEIISNRIEVKGFIVIDSMVNGTADKYIQTLKQGVKDGKVKLGEEVETVVPTAFEDVPKTWSMLFSGGNTGKLITAFKA